MEEEEYLTALNLEEKNLILVRRLLYSLRRRKIRGSYEVAKQTAKLLKEILDTEEWNTAQQAINFLHKLGFLLSKIQPVELSSGNIIRRVLYFIRDWYLKYKSGNFKQLENRDDRKTGLASGPTLRRLLTFDDDDFSTPFEDLKAQVIDDIVELLDELDGLYHSVSEEANHHIHSKEIIMTYGRSNTVVEFLKEAAKERDFSVVVAECAPSNSGHLTASNLSQHEIDTTLIPDSAIFAMMARVNKVIVGTHAVLADGGLIGSSGLRMLAQAAKYYSVPFVVCAGMYKICPLYLSTHLDNFLDLNSPSQILNFEEVDRITKSNQNGVTVQNPGLDFVPPELVSLFLTNAGTFSPSYISRVLSEFYFQEDHSFRTITHSHAQHTSGVDSIAIDSSDDDSSP